MGIISWWRGAGGDGKASDQSQQQPSSPPNPAPKPPPPPAEAPGMNGAVEVPRPPPPPPPPRTTAEKVTVFEFGSVAASADKVTLAGYCPVSDDLEPCRWEILPAASADSPQFRVAF